VDLDPPVINVTGETSVIVMQLGTYEEYGATAIDAIDGGVPVTTLGLEAVSTAQYTLPGAPHVITYSSEDAAGNVASVTRTVEVTRCAASLFAPIPVIPPVALASARLPALGSAATMFSGVVAWHACRLCPEPSFLCEDLDPKACATCQEGTCLCLPPQEESRVELESFDPEEDTEAPVLTLLGTGILAQVSPLNCSRGGLCWGAGRGGGEFFLHLDWPS